MLKYLFCFVVFLSCFNAQRTDPDLPGFPANMMKIEKGSLVIAMDTVLQSADGRSFNLKAYGLVVNLLHAKIPVYWAINSAKTFQGVDFSVSASLVAPSAQPAASRAFKGGPFIVDVFYETAAMDIIKAYGNGVKVYKTQSEVDVDVRYTLRFKPFVGVLDSSMNAKIQMAYLARAGLTEGLNGHYRMVSKAEAAVVNDKSCLTILTEPHFVEDGPEALPFVSAMQDFVSSGGNFLAQCAGMGTYEQCSIRDRKLDSSECKDGRFLTTNGLNIPKGLKSSKGSFVVTHPSSPFTQFDMDFVNTGGSVAAMGLRANNESPFRTGSGAYMAISQLGGPSYAAHGKLPEFFGLQGGNVFYLTGHDYDDKLGGVRMFLNAVLVPSNRPTQCGLTEQVPEREMALAQSEQMPTDTEGHVEKLSSASTHSGSSRIQGWVGLSFVLLGLMSLLVSL